MTHSRRTFLRSASAAAGAALVGVAIPSRWLSATPGAFFSAQGLSPIDEAELRALAHRALDAATAAGATYADVRVNMAHGVSVSSTWESTSHSPFSWGPTVTSAVDIGVRAIAGGAWGFAGRATRDPIEVARIAELAVVRARAAADPKGGAPPFRLAPAAVTSDGRWDTPIDVDPFAVPFGEMQAFLLEASTPAGRVVERMNGIPVTGGLAATVGFQKTERIFASSDGSTIWQRLNDAFVSAVVIGSAAQDRLLEFECDVDGLPSGHFGYEALTGADLAGKLVVVAEQLARDLRLPARPAEVGRYDAVLGAPMVGDLVFGTIGQALRLDRARGDLANTDGTSYAAPPLDALGAYRIGTPLLTITADRSRPRTIATVGWDEDGVRPDDFTLVEDGVVADYITTRDTALDLAPWYGRKDRPMRSHGCAAGIGLKAPAPMVPNLIVRPATGSASTDDLIKELKRGLYLPSSTTMPDQQLVNVMAMGRAPVFEVVNGKIVGLVKQGALMFNTPRFWKQLDALGGSASVVRVRKANGEGQPAAEIAAVPARVRQVDLVSYGKEA